MNWQLYWTSSKRSSPPLICFTLSLPSSKSAFFQGKCTSEVARIGSIILHYKSIQHLSSEEKPSSSYCAMFYMFLVRMRGKFWSLITLGSETFSSRTWQGSVASGQTKRGGRFHERYRSGSFVFRAFIQSLETPKAEVTGKTPDRCRQEYSVQEIVGGFGRVLQMSRQFFLMNSCGCRAEESRKRN